MLGRHAGYVIFTLIDSYFAKFKIKIKNEIIFVNNYKISVFNIILRKPFKRGSEECEYHFVTITESILKSNIVVKASTFISQKNINCGTFYGFNVSDVCH